MTKRQKKILAYFGATLLIILIMFGICGAKVQIFNSKQRAIEFNLADTQEVSGDATADAINGDLSIVITPRSGETDSWIKKINSDKGDSLAYVGVIYDMTVSNNTQYDVKDWAVRIDMPEDCYFNNAWCGEIEFHQHVNGEEIVQAIDLRNYASLGTEFEVKAEFADSDLLIPLRKGEYIRYIPSVKDKEDTIDGKTASDADSPYVTSGFITYHYTDDENDLSPLSFTSGTIEYHLHSTVYSEPLFKLAVIAATIWILALLICIIVEWQTRKLRRQNENDNRIIRQAMSTFMGFIDAKDASTNGHSGRVAKYARDLAIKYGLSDEQARNVYLIGLMHDCGKIAIPDSILCKPGKLTDEEYEIIKSHTVEGGKILKNFNSIAHIREGALYHHERYDGKGYPEGLAGEDIPLVARIICVADSFDAMNSDRCYRERLTKAEIISEIKKGRGTQFDPILADYMLELINEKEAEFFE